MPNLYGQKVVEDYNCKKTLVKPNMTYKKALKWILSLEFLSIVVSIILYILHYRFGIFSHLSGQSKHQIIWHFYSVTSIVVYLLFLRKMLIILIELYQHYAPEDLRRRCKCTPSCSEYAILALKKYGILMGVHKIRIRLFKTCQGNAHPIDYP